MSGKKNTYLRLNGYCIIISVIFLTFFCFFVASIVLYSRGIMEGAGLYIMALLLFALIQYSRLYTYPATTDERFEIYWLFYPCLTRKFAYSEIEKVVFTRKVSYGLHYTMTIHLKNGKRLRLMDMVCMPFSKVGDLIKDLDDHGVETDNQLRVQF